MKRPLSLNMCGKTDATEQRLAEMEAAFSALKQEVTDLEGG